MRIGSRIATLAILGLLVVGVVACNGTTSTTGDMLGGSSGEGQLTVAIHDAPADFTAINVTVSALTVYPAQGGRMEISNGLPVKFNLLDYVGPDHMLNLVTDLVPAGDYDRIDVTLSAVEVVTTEGSQSLPLPPEGRTISVPVNFTVDDGGQVTVSLDFNADASFQVVGNGMVFTPTITMD